ncbi:MAG TPA: DMT family transporter [Acidimicrobiales bacterium]|nr:DMT family transporter [Acidimicrobiales bacterium]
MKFLAVSLALVAACSNAASNVIQRLTNREEQHVRTLSLRLIVDLLHRPLWFGGLGAVMLSFILQASALRFGPLALVEPLVICELPLTFLGAALVLHAPLGWREWGAAAVMTAGLAALVTFLGPRGGIDQRVHPLVWAIGLAASIGAVAGFVLAGWRADGDTRAAFYGAATGIEFGLTAALMKGTVVQLSSGIVSLFYAWQTYAMIAAGVLGMFLVQNAMQSGKIVAAQPGITLLDPFVAIAWGIFAFNERTSDTGLHLALSTAGGLLMVGGAMLLSRSPILEHDGTRAGRNGAAGRAGATKSAGDEGPDTGDPERART